MSALLLVATMGHAATRTSTATGGIWASGSTWVGGIAPTATDAAIIATTGTNAVTLGAATTCIGVTVNSGSILSIGSYIMTVNGSITNNGEINATTGQLNQAAIGTITNSGSILFSGTGKLSIWGSLSNTGTLTLGDSPVDFVGSNNTAYTIAGFTTTGLVTFKRTRNTLTLVGDVSAGGLTINGTGGTLNLGTNRTHTFSGAITITAGTLNGGTSSNLITSFVGTAWNRTGTFTTGTGTVTLNGNGNQAIAGTATTFNNLTLAGSGTKTFTARPTVNGILSVEDNAVASTYATYGAAATLQYKATTNDITMGPELRPNTTSFTSTGGLVIDAGSYTVTLNENKTAFASKINVASGTFDLSSFTINRSSLGGSLTLASGAALKIGSTNTLPSNYTTHSINASSTVEYDGANQTVTTPNSSQTYGNLILSGSGTKTIQTGVISIATDFTTAGTITTTLPIGMTFNGNVVLGAGTTVTTGAYTHSVKGNFTNDGCTFGASGSTINFNGTTAQTIGGLASTTFDNLTLNNANGLTINNNQSIDGVLTLTNGMIDTGSNTLTIGCTGSIVNASSARHINGKLAMTYCSAGSKTFPIGKGGNYRPLTLNYTTLTGSSTVTAEQMESILPGSIPSDIDLFATRYWQLSESGGSGYAFELTLDGTDWTPTSYLKMLKGDGSTNAHYGVTTPNYTNSTAFTSFGNFGLGQLTYVTWLGTTNDWFTGSNWTCEVVPASTDDIRIPSAVSFLPTISGTSPANDFSIASTGKLLVLDGASVSLESGPLFTLQSGATVSTGVGSKIILKSDARYLNLSSSTPTLEVQRQLTGSKGWRMLSAPVASTYSDMFKSPLVTQGFTGSSFPTLQPNLLWWLESDGGTALQSWRQPTNLTDALVAGRGLFHYVFNGAGRLNLDGSSSGSNYSDVLPQTLSATGTELFNGSGSFNFGLTYTPKSTSQTPSPTDTIYYDLNALDEGWNLLGNPTASTLDWDAASGWTKTNIDNSIYVWDPSALGGNGDYLTWNGSTGTLGNGRIAPFQAFWIHANAAPALSLNNNVKTSTAGTFLRSTIEDESINLPITLSIDDLSTTSFVSFSNRGVTGPDRWDAYRMESMSENRVDLYTLSAPEFVSPLVINNLPKIEDALTTIPLYYDINLPNTSTGNTVSLSWALPSNWPSDWNISLMDHRTKEVLSMKERSTYSFDAVSKKEVVAQVGNLPMPKTLLKPLSTNSLLRSSSTEQPFSIVVYKGADIPYISPKPNLVGSTTNPFRQQTTIRFSLPEKSKARLEVFSAQGKKVAVLIDEVFPAGVTEIPWNASNLAPDIYLIRFVSGSTVETKKAVLLH